MCVPVTGSSSAESTAPASSVNGEVVKGSSLWAQQARWDFGKESFLLQSQASEGHSLFVKEGLTVQHRLLINSPCSGFSLLSTAVGYRSAPPCPHSEAISTEAADSHVEIHITQRQQAQSEPSLLCRPLRILPSFISFMCDHICVCAGMFTYMCGDQRTTSIVFPQEHSPFYFETGALSDLELIN